MKLNRLELQNFKGIKTLVIEPQGRNMAISGKNGTGKTTIADAYAWVLFGKNFDGRSIEPEIKQRDPETGLAPNDGGVTHAVEAELSLDNGSTVTLRKEYVEKWEKKRGAAESEFRGHTTNYSIDGVPLPKKEYDKRVAGIIPEEAGRLLSLPLHFCANLNWKERRRILVEMCGEVSDADILESDELAPLKKLLEGKSVDDYRKAVKAKMKKVNDELKGIPERIDELAKAGTDVDEAARDAIIEHLKGLAGSRTELAAKIARLENGGEAAEIQKEIAGIEAAMTKFKAAFEAEYTKKTGEAESAIRGCVAEIERLGAEMERLQKKASQLETINKTTDEQAQKLREEWTAENAKEANLDVSDTCPCCGQKLPPEMVEGARAKALADFNRKKSETLAGITAKGRRMMEQKARNIEEIEAIKTKMEERMQQVNEFASKKAEAEKLLAEAEAPDVSASEEYRNMEAEKAALVEKAAAARKGDDSGAIAAAKERIEAIDREIAADNEKLAAIAQAESLRKRKAELMDREKELGEIYSELEQGLDLAERFVRAKVKLTEDSINSHFKFVRFTMFRQQVNGGLEECCEPTIDGVPFGEGLNTGGEMKAALDILDTLSAHFKIRLPVFIDNSESYTSESLPPVENQLIRLVVSEGQETLAVEVEGEEKQEVEAVRKAA